MDQTWSHLDITADFLETKAAWLKEPRKLHHSSLRFFSLAGKLVSLSRDDYELANLAFFQAIIGLDGKSGPCSSCSAHPMESRTWRIC